ncbi:hypothetical protein [Sporosarcina sp. P33]|uniref:hypothetical protein n=1 Tax=Sporosarcina sp. P33 TaxID=1930764 RepID=UPI0009C0D348|nr:hypothetical protein [Sporosarcina sp. P33]ARD46807.1 hypothetical protein SporoP33_00180 [Sporosarcina sp. P33]
MDEKGQSWPEAMLALLIVMIIYGSLLPMASTMTSSISAKKQAMIAAETSYQAAIHFKTSGRTSGRRTYEEIHYDWSVDPGQICVAYEVLHAAASKCVKL